MFSIDYDQIHEPQIRRDAIVLPEYVRFVVDYKEQFLYQYPSQLSKYDSVQYLLVDIEQGKTKRLFFHQVPNQLIAEMIKGRKAELLDNKNS